MLFAPDATAAPAALQAWAPESWAVAPDWRPTVQAFLASATGQALAQQLQQRLGAGAVVYPPQPLRALELTPLAHVKVVVLGQDPYHGPGQAEGLAFSVADGVKVPPSLRNIFKELARDLAAPAVAARRNGSLAGWARQGVLLLNTCFTVEQGAAASHARLGWEALSNVLLAACNQAGPPKVFMLWGAHAQARASLLGARHLLLQANHPSPLSALRPPQPFIGCGHFGQANRWLVAQGQRPVDWLC